MNNASAPTDAQSKDAGAGSRWAGKRELDEDRPLGRGMRFKQEPAYIQDSSFASGVTMQASAYTLSVGAWHYLSGCQAKCICPSAAVVDLQLRNVCSKTHEVDV